MSDRNDVFEIDLTRLDYHWVDQVRCVLTQGDALVDDKDSLWRAKAELDVIKSEVAKKIRSDPEKYGLQKTTVDIIKDAVIVHPEVLTAQELVFNENYKVDMRQSMLNALSDRKAALENLVKLHGQQYFATPQTDEAGHEVLKEQSSSKLKAHLRKRREQKD